MNYRHVLKFIDEIRMARVMNPNTLGTEREARYLVSSKFMQDLYRTNYQKSIEKAVVVDCQNVVQMAIDHTKRPQGVEIGPADFPRMRLPYPELWMEYLPVDDLREKNIQIERIGILARDLVNAPNATAISAKSGMENGLRPLELSVFLKMGGQCYGPQGLMIIWVTDDGVIDRTAIIPMNDRRTYVKPPVKPRLDELGRAVIELNTGYDNESARMLYSLFCLPALYCLQFMNCRNIEQEKREPPTTINERHRRQHPPLVSYRVLKINRRGPQNARNGSGTGEKGLTAYHICRGHFKHFTAERPLLGKHTGTFWWEDQARGRKQNGEVIKDYEVQP